jgi:hypothetical protein
MRRRYFRVEIDGPPGTEYECEARRELQVLPVWFDVPPPYFSHRDVFRGQMTHSSWSSSYETTIPFRHPGICIQNITLDLASESGYANLDRAVYGSGTTRALTLTLHHICFPFPTRNSG